MPVVHKAIELPADLIIIPSISKEEIEDMLACLSGCADWGLTSVVAQQAHECPSLLPRRTTFVPAGQISPSGYLTLSVCRCIVQTRSPGLNMCRELWVEHMDI